MRKIKEIVIVEGRYDKNTVSQAVDATIIETAGFGIFSDKEKIALLRKLAKKRGLIILTDSDKAGFFIRGRLRGMIDGIDVKHAYIPDIQGKEKRKSTTSKEQKLGVEGMSTDVIIKALELSGATFDIESDETLCNEKITKTDLYSIGLSGGTDSAQKRHDLKKRLDLPERLSANALLDILNALYTREEFFELLANRKTLDWYLEG